MNAPFSNRAKYLQDNHPEIIRKIRDNIDLTKEDLEIIKEVCKKMPYKNLTPN